MGGRDIHETHQTGSPSFSEKHNTYIAQGLCSVLHVLYAVSHTGCLLRNGYRLRPHSVRPAVGGYVCAFFSVCVCVLVFRRNVYVL